MDPLVTREARSRSHGEERGNVLWLGFSVSYFFWCLLSELRANAGGNVYSKLCLTKTCLGFLRGLDLVAFENRWVASLVQVQFVARRPTKKGQDARSRGREYWTRRSRGGGGSGEGLRSVGGSANRASVASGTVTPDYHAHVLPLENVYANASDRRVETHDRY